MHSSNNNLTFGRIVLYSHHQIINSENLLKSFREILPFYYKNQSEILFLQEYRKGKQPILYREKKVRKDICNKVVKNRANEIINFKVGYLLGEPMQYISRSNNEDIQATLEDINNCLYLLKKSNKDKLLAEHMYVCGTAYRMILANPNYKGGADESPFNIYTPDPRYCGIVYSSSLGHEPLYCFTETETYIDDELKTKFTIYTKNEYYEIIDDEIVAYSTHSYGFVPMVEYSNNSTRMGAFEPIISILNAINLITSNRVDGVEQFVQSLMKFVNVDIDKEGLELLREEGAIKLVGQGLNGEKQDVEFLTAELNQGQVQTLVDSLDRDVLILCGMPNRNGGNSTSDTGTAVIMRDGWSDAEARAKDDELSFKDSEIDFLERLLKIYKTLKGKTDIKVSDIDVRFTRKNYENIVQKSTVLATMLASDKLHPKLAFTHCGLFTDPELAYQLSKEYMNNNGEK